MFLLGMVAAGARAETNAFEFNGLILGQRAPLIGTTKADRSPWTHSLLKDECWTIIPSKSYDKAATLKEPSCGAAELYRTNGVVSTIRIYSPLLQNHVAIQQWAQQAIRLVKQSEGQPREIAPQLSEQSGSKLRSQLKKTGFIKAAQWDNAHLMLFLKPPEVEDTSDKWKYYAIMTVHQKRGQ